MPLPLTPLEPENAPHEAPERPAAPEQPAIATDPDAPLSFVPHEPAGAVARGPVKIRTGRFGELEEHELVRLLDTIEDERAKARFRESVYISVFIWIIVAWVAFYGPRYLWHAPKISDPMSVLSQRELTQLNAPVLRQPLPKVAPKVDTKTLEHLRSTAPKPAPQPAPQPTPQPTPQPAAQPAPAPPPPAASLPSAPTPQPSHAPAPIVDAPTPQPSFRPSPFGNAPAQPNRGSMPRSGDTGGPVRAPSGANMGGGMEVLSDTQGVDFSRWTARTHDEILRNWGPLLPIETEPPLAKQGETFIRVKILPDGTIADMRLEGSSHDVAIDKSCWGAITSQGQFPPLPKEFHGPFIEFRLHFLVNKTLE